MRVVESDVELVQQADVVLSIVVPSCAEQIVDRIIAACRYGGIVPVDPSPFSGRGTLHHCLRI